MRTHSEKGQGADFQVAHELGERAVAIGLETLDLAKIHEQSLALLQLPDSSSAARKALTASAMGFFTEALMPIEKTHCAALEANADLNELAAKLDERTSDLADSNRELQQQITGRTRAEAALRDSEAASGRLLGDSWDLEQKLRKMARRILAATEAERKKMSLQLNDEIAQTLIGINIRLLALKHEVATDHAALTKEIATTQRLIGESVELINRLAHEFSSQHEPPTD